MTALLLLVILADMPGDIRTRTEFSWPEPAGVTENLWAGGNISFYERLRLHSEKWEAVVLTEKDAGENWGDLITGGVRYSTSDISVSAGALRTQFARGIVFSNSGSWSSADPLALSKAPLSRLRLEPAESPGVTDGNSLTGIGSIWQRGEFSLYVVLGWSLLDHSGSGLHRTETEEQNKHDAIEKLAAFRAGWGPAGVSFAAASREGADSTVFSRFGADINLASSAGEISGEILIDTDSTLSFSLSAARGSADLRHCLTVSRNSGEIERASGPYGVSHDLGAGYGVIWKIGNSVVAEAGALFLNCGETEMFKSGFLLTERTQGRLEFTQRIKYSDCEGERLIRCRLTESWSPNSRLTLSVKTPFAFYRNQGGESENGYGLEIRMKHRFSRLIGYSVSAAASQTDGWESRIYAYSLSFPGEFGSTVLYGNSLLLQASLSLHISEDTAVRARFSRYFREGAEWLGSGSTETPGPFRTTAGCQLDWSF
ncbi:hypothetical protein CSA37_07655 [Candidatus Fermentibacteria bacterium]|nr:MAG: hypothetical protein CSA37_07655 [Candidatus Fermentibacteria bacterium]